VVEREETVTMQHCSENLARTQCGTAVEMERLLAGENLFQNGHAVIGALIYKDER